MPSSSSIASEYYKLVDLWKSIEADRNWRLAVWSAKAEDILLIDKFLEVEQSLLGLCDDIFFRFETSCEGDVDAYPFALWDEYISWFEEDIPEKYDMYRALKQDGLLLAEYHPDTQSDKTLINLWNEMLRFRSCIKGHDDFYFCVWLPSVREDMDEMTDRYADMLRSGIPEGIRLTVIDSVSNRKIKLRPSKEVVVLSPALNMRAAIDNDMDKNCGEFNPVDPGNKYDRQLRITMECATKNSEPLLTKEVNMLYACSKELNRSDIEMSTPLIASQVYYMINSFDHSHYHVDRSIALSKEAMESDNEDRVAYTVWIASMFQKGAILYGQKKREAAITVYEAIADETTARQDILYIMESYRMSGFLHYENHNNEKALERFLLSLYAGSHLDTETRRQSTFLFSANLALLLCRDIRSEEDVSTLENHLQQWLGEDWKDLVEGRRMTNAKKRRKTSIFSRN